MSKENVGHIIPIIGRLIVTWDEVLFKLRVSFDVLISRNKVFLESSHHVETHIDVLVEALGVHISLSFKFCLDDEFIYFW